MQNKDSERFGEIITVLNEVYGDPSKSLSPLRLEFYFKSLEDLSIEQLNDAAVRIGQTKTFHVLPTPAEIREATQGKSEDRAEFAFEDLVGEIQSGIYCRGAVFEDGAIVKCIEAMGGIEQVSDWRTDDPEWHRKEFIKLYRAYSTRGPWPEDKVIGAHEHRNALHGYTQEFMPPALMVGNQEWIERKMLAGAKAPELQEGGVK